MASSTPLAQAKRWVAALSALGNEQWADAVERFKQFMKHMDDPAARLPIYHNLAACYLEQGLYDEALAIWDKLDAVKPDDPDVWFGRASTNGCAGRLEEAIQAFTRFRQLAPDKARQFGTKEMIGDLQQELRGELPAGSFLYEHLDAQLENNLDLGDYDLVERKARHMIGLINERPEGHFALGLALIRQKQPEAALPNFLAANAIEPNFVPTLYNIGYCLFRANQPEQAMVWLERVLEQDQTYVAALKLMGDIQQQWEQPEKAVGLWQQALTFQSDYEPAQQALFKAGAGPEPEEPISPITAQLQRYGPLAKGRMRHPRIYRSGSVTLTVDPDVGFVLEDADNVHNGTVYAGGPFHLAQMDAVDIRHFVGVLKLLVRKANKYTCRDMAILAYYPDQATFNYRLEMTADGLVSSSNGRLLPDQTPSHFKVRVDSDLESPFGSPFSGYFIYLAQKGRPGVVAMTLGLARSADA